MVVDGHTGIEHSIPVARDLRRRACSSGAQTKVGYTPTLVVGYGGLWGENYWYEKTNVWEDARLLRDARVVEVVELVSGTIARRRERASRMRRGTNFDSRASSQTFVFWYQ